MLERQELYCHNCGKYVQFNIDMSLNGNHVLTCPVCGHEHCRVVRDGVITGDRWDSRNGDSYNVTTITSTTISTYSSYSTTNSTADVYLYSSWMSVGTA